MNRKVNWDILGCAGIAEKAFIPAVRESRNGVLVGITARDMSRARDWADRFGFRRSYKDYQELIEDPAIAACFESIRTGRPVEIPNTIHQGGVVS